MAERNADQVADWYDQSGQRWVAHQARLDARLAVFGRAAIEAAAPATGQAVGLCRRQRAAIDPGDMGCHRLQAL
jgi:hypothetical protein